MKTLAVHYCGWGEDWRLGTLADDGTNLLFEYSAEALSQQLELSPRHLKLRAQAYGGFPAHQMRLPGLVADALPDGAAFGDQLQDLPLTRCELFERWCLHVLWIMKRTILSQDKGSDILVASQHRVHSQLEF